MPPLSHEVKKRQDWLQILGHWPPRNLLLFVFHNDCPLGETLTIFPSQFLACETKKYQHEKVCVLLSWNELTTSGQTGTEPRIPSMWAFLSHDSFPIKAWVNMRSSPIYNCWDLCLSWSHFIEAATAFHSCYSAHILITLLTKKTYFEIKQIHRGCSLPKQWFLSDWTTALYTVDFGGLQT